MVLYAVNFWRNNMLIFHGGNSLLPSMRCFATMLLFSTLSHYYSYEFVVTQLSKHDRV